MFIIRVSWHVSGHKIVLGYFGSEIIQPGDCQTNKKQQKNTTGDSKSFEDVMIFVIPSVTHDSKFIGFSVTIR
jgi:hypothetical protein